MKAVLKNMRKMFMLDSEYSEFYEIYYFMKFYKGLDSSKLFESLAKGEFSGKKNFIYLFKTVSAKTLPVE